MIHDIHSWRITENHFFYLIGLVILFELDSAIFCKISDTKVICKRACQCGERAIDQRSCLRQHPRAAVSPRASLTFQPGKATQTTGLGECPNDINSNRYLGM